MGAFEDFNYAELPLRPALLKGSTYTGNPNDSTDPVVNGAPLGTCLLQDDVDPKKTWQKQGTASDDWKILNGSFSGLPVFAKYTVTAAFAASESLDLTDGSGGTTGACSILAGSSSIDLPAGWDTDPEVDIKLNGVSLSKGDQVTIPSAEHIAILNPLDHII